MRKGTGGRRQEAESRKPASRLLQTARQEIMVAWVTGKRRREEVLKEGRRKEGMKLSSKERRKMNELGDGNSIAGKHWRPS